MAEADPPSGLPEPQDSAPERGWVAPELAEELPGLGILTTTVAGGAGRSTAAAKERLRELSDRFGGRQAIVLRQRPIPWAYRVFFRHIGLDPDETWTPVEQLAFDRMRDGRFKSRDRVRDAIAIAIAEVGVAVEALDADAVEGRLGLRLAGEGEPFAGRTSPLPEGKIVIADERRALAILFGDLAAGVEATKRTERTALVALGVRGVPDVALEEALWVASSAMLA